MDAQFSSDFSFTSWIQYFYIPAFFTLGTLKAVFISQVKDYEDSISFFEVVFCEWKEFLLPCCVPNTYSYFIIVKCYYFLLETQAQSRGIEMTEWICGSN